MVKRMNLKYFSVVKFYSFFVLFCLTTIPTIRRMMDNLLTKNCRVCRRTIIS